MPDIEANLLPGFLGRYAQAVSKFNQTSEALPAMVGLSVAATCLQKKYVVSPKEGYKEPVNLWTVTALKPSERKTPVFTAMTKPLREWERERREVMQEQIDKVRTDREIKEKRIEKLTKDAAKAKSEEDLQRITREIEVLRSEMPDEIRAPKLWIGDVTPERLQQLLVDHGEKMSLLSDEGGIFEILGGLYSNGKVNVDVFLQAYSGSPVGVDRGNREAYLENPALSFALTVQPAILQDLGNGSKRRFRDNGMLARFLYCIPESKVGKRNARVEYVIPADVEHDYQTGIRRLLNLRGNNVEGGKEIPHVLTLIPEAREVWYDFAQEIEDMLAEGGDMEDLADWGGKLPGTALRIAGVFHVVKGGDHLQLISGDTIREAVNVCRSLVGHAKYAFGLIGKSATESDAKKIYEWILRKEIAKFTKRECQNDMQSRFKTADMLFEPFEELQKRNIIRKSIRTGVGRPSEEYEVNPKVRK